MRVNAMFKRILRQLSHDRRTLALMMFAPLILLAFVYFVFDANPQDLNVGVVNAPEKYIERLEDENLIVKRYDNVDDARSAISKGKIVGAVDMISRDMHIYIDGTSSSKSTSVLSAIQSSMAPASSIPTKPLDIDYIYGTSDMTMFDNFGSTLIGFIIFFFVFLVSGIAFLQERTTGTLERLLSTPIKRWELIMGYVFGYGVVTIVQALLISFFIIYVLDVIMVGSIWLILIITLLCAICALTLGILISSAAENEFQMIQFVPIIIIPQLFFSGLFDLSPGWLLFGKIMPIHYAADALNEVMIRGNGFKEVAFDIGMLVAFSIAFILINIRLLKKYRRL